MLSFKSDISFLTLDAACKHAQVRVRTHTLYGWVERICCFISQVMAGQTPVYHIFFPHPVFPPHSSLYSLLPIHSLVFSIFSLFFCHLMVFFLSSFYFRLFYLCTFYGPCHGSLIISASYVFFIYRLPLFCCNGEFAVTSLLRYCNYFKCSFPSAVPAQVKRQLVVLFVFVSIIYV